MAEGFRTVLELIRQYKKLCVYWTINYNFADELLERFLHRQLQKDRSVSLHIMPHTPRSCSGPLGWSCSGPHWERLVGP